jgi:hypothetical protein
MAEVRKLLDTEREFTLIIDSQRTITVTPTMDGQSVVIGTEDPNSIAIVEITMSEVDGLIEGLDRVRRLDYSKKVSDGQG